MNGDRRRPGLLIIAARQPIPGFTKTRLGRAIGMDEAAALYRAFLTDLANRFFPAASSGRFDLAWAFTPSGCDFAGILADLSAFAARCDGAVRYVAQEGEGWDVRQQRLLRWGCEVGYDRVVLTASDSPQMPVSSVEYAFAALESHDIALGRVHDGGYYAIGTSGTYDVLTGVPMSTASAADAVCARAEAQGLRVAELPATFDIDEAADLDLLTEALQLDPTLAPATHAELRRHVVATSGARMGRLTA
jgi:glycosyltransferase A (GT-A) superfamily protein (DUF2064 family)